MKINSLIGSRSKLYSEKKCSNCKDECIWFHDISHDLLRNSTASFRYYREVTWNAKNVLTLEMNVSFEQSEKSNGWFKTAIRTLPISERINEGMISPREKCCTIATVIVIKEPGADCLLTIRLPDRCLMTSTIARISRWHDSDGITMAKQRFT